MKPTKLFRGIPNKRECLARALEGLGVIGLLERVSAMCWPGLIVLTYHRITEPGTNPFYDPVISATPESFRTQVKWLQDHVQLLTFTELLARVESGLRWREPAVFLTFDDGYRDNFDVAVPILRAWNVPAMFFIPTAFLDSPTLPWWDYVAYVIKQTKVPRLQLDQTVGADNELPTTVIDLETTPQIDAIRTVIRTLLNETITDVKWFLMQLSEFAEVEVDCDRLGSDLFMTWEQVQTLANVDKSLMVGAHGHNHHKLAGLNEELQRRELAESKHILEHRLGCDVAALAYPYGWTGTYTARTKTLAAGVGYRLAFTSQEGVNQPNRLDPYEVSRLGVGMADSPTLLRGRVALHATFGASFL
jgi:peptidoglycan/xylan/chitin deacetylase (PgdA/CDA1 family)